MVCYIEGQGFLSAAVTYCICIPLNSIVLGACLFVSQYDWVDYCPSYWFTVWHNNKKNRLEKQLQILDNENENPPKQ